MWKLILSQVSVEGWVINTNVHSFFNIPSDPLRFPVHCGEAFRVDRMPYSVTVVVFIGDGALRCSFNYHDVSVGVGTKCYCWNQCYISLFQTRQVTNHILLGVSNYSVSYYLLPSYWVLSCLLFSLPIPHQIPHWYSCHIWPNQLGTRRLFWDIH